MAEIKDPQTAHFIGRFDEFMRSQKEAAANIRNDLRNVQEGHIRIEQEQKRQAQSLSETCGVVRGLHVDLRKLQVESNNKKVGRKALVTGCVGGVFLVGVVVTVATGNYAEALGWLRALVGIAA